MNERPERISAEPYYAATEFERERPWSAGLPWEYVQDDENERRGVARVLNARNELICETTPLNADLIVCAVNFLGANDLVEEARTHYKLGIERSPGVRDGE